MQCQKCDREATFHITDLVDGKPNELHLCEHCAQSFLSPSGEEAAEVMPAMAGLLAQHLAVGETADQLARLDQRACPVCSITFLEFRKQGRLGCPHDYVFFAEELDPLLLNIHDQTHHIGKVPKRCSQGADQQTQLIRLRREMKEAIASENYERASQLRDDIRAIEEAKTKEAITDVAITDVAITDVAKTDVAKTDVAKTDVAKTDVAKTDVAKTDVAKTDVAKTDVAKTDVAKTDVAKTDVAKTDEAKTDDIKTKETDD